MSELALRLATRSDIGQIRAMLADDKLGATREDLSKKGLEKYHQAFEDIKASNGNELWVAEVAGQLVGTWQVTYIPYLSRGGYSRCLIEAVRTASHYRGQGIGSKMMLFAIEQARERGCLLVQLTSDKSRPDAHRFYEKLGFQATHIGMKLQLS